MEGSEFPISDSTEEWNRIIPAERTMPQWAKIYWNALPRTTVAMLRLDDFHRRHSPLGNRLACWIRWKVATTLENEYAVAYAQYDLKQTGLEDEDLARLSNGELELTPQQKLCLEFAEKLTRAGYSLTDEELQELRNEIGEQDLVALVQTIAFANFQYRLFIAVDVQLQEGEPLASFAPFEIVDDIALPDRKSIDDLYLEEPAQEYMPPKSFTEVSTELFLPSMKKQQQRQARISLPDQSRIDRLDQEDQNSANRIVWSRVAYGFQPEMTRLWFQCLRAYQREAKPDSFFLNSVFWVVTRSNECFY